MLQRSERIEKRRKQNERKEETFLADCIRKDLRAKEMNKLQNESYI